jgi:hypothetical protein
MLELLQRTLHDALQGQPCCLQTSFENDSNTIRMVYCEWIKKLVEQFSTPRVFLFFETATRRRHCLAPRVSLDK